MSESRRVPPKKLGELEQPVMDYVWSHGPTTAEACREALLTKHLMKDSTVRTVLRRLEAKGFLRHNIEGRTYVYRAVHAQRAAYTPDSETYRALSRVLEFLHARRDDSGGRPT